MNYLDGIYKTERLPENCKLIVLGYSQGVSIAMRWVAHSKIPCDQLVLYAGGIPEELQQEDFDFLPEATKLTAIVGNADEYLTAERWKKERAKLVILFQDRVETLVFKGGHEVKKEVISSLV